MTVRMPVPDRSVSDRLLLGSPLRRPRVAGWVIVALLAAIAVSSLLVTIALRSAGQELPQPGPPPSIGFARAWLQASAQNLIVFCPFVTLMLLLLWRSGRWERRVIREELAGEVGGPVTPAEYEQITRDGMFRTRRLVPTDRRRSAALVNAQHELAFRKRRVRGDGGDPERDPRVAGWRREIAQLRAERPAAG
jgi:hypothetical protein